MSAFMLVKHGFKVVSRFVPKIIIKNILAAIWAQFGPTEKIRVLHAQISQMSKDFNFTS